MASFDDVKWMRDYFPISLVKTAELDASQKYVFGYHPHGIFPYGSMIAFGTDALSISKLFPGINFRVMTMGFLFYLPGFREWAAAQGAGSVSKDSCVEALRRGNSPVIVFGGTRDMGYAIPGTYDLVVKRRLGFIKLAIQNGAHVVPIFSFGENDTWETAGHPWLRRFREISLKLVGRSFVIPYGQGLFDDDKPGLMPYRRPIVIVVGRPIECPHQSDPTNVVLINIQEQYLAELQNIWEQYKDIYAKDRKSELRFVD
ncbi:hypothetical protein SmJEL517_g02924 [Synchytrium microbalum]|uniref:diacylglycerol O-acyltransferase n=1 Tax=Synchytrium microbalum TaxID=1806994 RepID=A0A507BZ31_9FUNG|nr:uncharacterized protein SmJEL517_g02924 [Synchytrium microbalum]TPX34530.1 hypothetical protein SmJEL517_g02924 [Synchytrium microbalum]